jgi:hypothetical protein
MHVLRRAVSDVWLRDVFPSARHVCMCVYVCVRACVPRICPGMTFLSRSLVRQCSVSVEITDDLVVRARVRIPVARPSTYIRVCTIYIFALLIEISSDELADSRAVTRLAQRAARVLTTVTREMHGLQHHVRTGGRSAR